MTDQTLHPRSSVSASEWRFVLVTTSTPHACMTTPPGGQYKGILINAPGRAQYFAWYGQYLPQNLSSEHLEAGAERPHLLHPKGLICEHSRRK